MWHSMVDLSRLRGYCGGWPVNVKAGSQYDASPAFRFVSSPIVTSSICEHPASRETERNEMQAGGRIDLDSISVSATV